jgi:RNA polymerase sigma-70 factor (ECF subfamily)
MSGSYFFFNYRSLLDSETRCVFWAAVSSLFREEGCDTMAISTEHAWYALHEPLRAFIRKRVEDRETAEDILQDVFLKMHLHADALRDEHKVESWIYQIARNLIIDHYRKAHQSISLEEAGPDRWLVEMPEEDLRATLAPSVAAMVNCLPENYREALWLTDYQGISQKALAERLGISFSGAKSRVQRARDKLKQLLLDCCHFELDRRGGIIDYQPRCDCCSNQGGSAGCDCSDDSALHQ